MQDVGRRSFFTGLGALLGAGAVIANAKEAPDLGETELEIPKQKSLGDIFDEFNFRDENRLNPVELAKLAVVMLGDNLLTGRTRYVHKYSRFKQQFARVEIALSDMDCFGPVKNIKYRIIDSVVSLAKTLGDWVPGIQIISNRTSEIGGMEWSNICFSEKIAVQVIRGYDCCQNIKITKLCVPFVYDESALEELSDEEINSKIREQMSARWDNKKINYFKGRYAKA